MLLPRGKGVNIHAKDTIAHCSKLSITFPSTGKANLEAPLLCRSHQSVKSSYSNHSVLCLVQRRVPLSPFVLFCSMALKTMLSYTPNVSESLYKNSSFFSYSNSSSHPHLGMETQVLWVRGHRQSHYYTQNLPFSSEPETLLLDQSPGPPGISPP